MKTVLISVVLLLVAGCGGEESADGKVSIAAAFHPLAEVALRVGGDRVRVTDLTPAGAEPHDLELTSEQVDTVLDADLTVLMGRGFQPSLEDIAADRDGGTIEVLRADDGDDPHVWLDPTRYASITSSVADALVDVDPAGASTYRAHAKAFNQQLASLDREMHDGLAHCDRRKIVTSHAAFGWLAARYHLTQEAIAGLAPDQEPDPARLAALADLVEADGLTTIFTESLVSPDVADSLAREVGVTTAVLNPLEALTKAEVAAGDDYLSVMRTNLKTLRRALGCT